MVYGFIAKYFYTCVCDHGTRDIANNCPGNHKQNCKGCDAGYYLADKKCHANVCTCAHGTPAIGLACETHGLQKCLSCHPGYYSSGSASDSCAPYECKCDHGSINEFGSQQVHCTGHGKQNCDKCDPGYSRLKTFQGERKCTPNTCTCPNGPAAAGAACTSDKAEICAPTTSIASTCEDGYHRAAGGSVENDVVATTQQCVPYQCTYDHCAAEHLQRPQKYCKADGQPNCNSCEDGYQKYIDPADPNRHFCYRRGANPGLGRGVSKIQPGVENKVKNGQDGETEEHESSCAFDHTPCDPPEGKKTKGEGNGNSPSNVMNQDIKVKRITSSHALAESKTALTQAANKMNQQIVDSTESAGMKEKKSVMLEQEQEISSVGGEHKNKRTAPAPEGVDRPSPSDTSRVRKRTTQRKNSSFVASSSSSAASSSFLSAGLYPSPSPSRGFATWPRNYRGDGPHPQEEQLVV